MSSSNEEFDKYLKRGIKIYSNVPKTNKSGIFYSQLCDVESMDGIAHRYFDLMMMHRTNTSSKMSCCLQCVDANRFFNEHCQLCTDPKGLCAGGCPPRMKWNHYRIYLSRLMASTATKYVPPSKVCVSSKMMFEKESTVFVINDYTGSICIGLLLAGINVKPCYTCPSYEICKKRNATDIIEFCFTYLSKEFVGPLRLANYKIGYCFEPVFGSEIIQYLSRGGYNVWIEELDDYTSRYPDVFMKNRGFCRNKTRYPMNVYDFPPFRDDRMLFITECMSNVDIVNCDEFTVKFD